MTISRSEHCARIFTESPVDKINFIFGSVHVSPDQFKRIAEAVRNGWISVRDLPPHSESAAEYNAVKTEDGPADSFSLKPLNEGDYATSHVRALLVHEAVHAIIDLNKSDISRLGGESAAFLAQTLYRLLRDGNRYRQFAHSSSDIRETAAIRLECLSVIRKLGLENACGIIPADSQAAIIRVVHAHPKYRKYSLSEIHPADGLQRM